MRKRKHEREDKRQMGQFMTPDELASRIAASIDLRGVERILEPSCGDGAFIRAVSDHANRHGQERSDRVLEAIEWDCDLYSRAAECCRHEGSSGLSIQLNQGDFFRYYLDRAAGDRSGNPLAEPFDLVIGNPPFGGTFDHAIEDELDRCLGTRLGRKIKKETYAFFIVASIALLRQGGRLVFICGNSILTIPTMAGLRNFLMETGAVRLHDLDEFSDETAYPMVVLEYTKGTTAASVVRPEGELAVDAIQATPNLSWGVTPDLADLFRGPLLGDYFVATSGMTTGKNELFVREVQIGGSLLEPYEFGFVQEPITVEYERKRARLGKLSAKREDRLRQAELRGDTEKRLQITTRAKPAKVQLPDPRYVPYNKANGTLLYSPPTHYIYWENNGEAILTFKRTGNWYLRGVGGQPYFFREGLTWQLVASRFNVRYLPPGYVLDSGAPCAFPREGTEPDETYFVIGWLLSPLANHILKTVINHTMNIQSKDFERMPYPWWVADESKREVIGHVSSLIERGRRGASFSWKHEDIVALGRYFNSPVETRRRLPATVPTLLFEF